MTELNCRNDINNYLGVTCGTLLKELEEGKNRFMSAKEIAESQRSEINSIYLKNITDELLKICEKLESVGYDCRKTRSLF